MSMYDRPVDRVQRALANLFADDLTCAVTTGPQPAPGDDVEVSKVLGRHGGRLWSALATVRLVDGTLAAAPCVGIWSGEPGGPVADFAGDVDHPADDVPPPVVRAAGAFRDAIVAQDIPYLAMTGTERRTYDLLRDVLEAEASGNATAVGRAMDAARSALVAVRPSLAGTPAVSLAPAGD